MNNRTRRLADSLFAFALAVGAASWAAPTIHAANWSVARVNHSLLTPPAGVTVSEMSGVTYVGPVDGAHRFIAVEQTKGELIRFDVALSDAGAITAVSNIAPIDITPTNDFEGIAYTDATRNSVFLSSENGAGLREISLATGNQLQAVTLPTVFGNARPNRSFESLTRARDGASMWIANEQALTVDGSLATAVAGTPVRLLKLNVDGNSVTPGPQFAYQVEPIHGSATFGSPQSGLSDLTVMPDGTLLALERSVAVTSPIYLSRIYEVNADAATDVSGPPFATGLNGQAFAPVTKELLWSGAVDAGSGQNMEGLALGPKLANGSWLLLGVVDNQNGGDPLSNNTIVAFTATPTTSADFDGNGVIDGNDFLRWQRGLGKPAGATKAEGDANRDGAVDEADLELWKGSFVPAAVPATQTVPEPAATLLLATGAWALVAPSRTLGRR